MKVALIEKTDKLGGTCLHVGCIPTKAMLFSAEFVRQSGVPALSMGRHTLQGVGEPQEVFALLPAEDPYFETESG